MLRGKVISLIRNFVEILVTSIITTFRELQLFCESFNELSKRERKLISDIANEGVIFRVMGRFSEEELIIRMISETRCSERRAQNLFKRLQFLGLELCKDRTDELILHDDEVVPETVYNLRAFCVMRNYAQLEKFLEYDKKMGIDTIMPQFRQEV